MPSVTSLPSPAFCRQPSVTCLVPSLALTSCSLFVSLWPVHCPFSGVFQHHKMCAKRGVTVDAREPESIYPEGSAYEPYYKHIYTYMYRPPCRSRYLAVSVFCKYGRLSTVGFACALSVQLCATHYFLWSHRYAHLCVIEYSTLMRKLGVRIARSEMCSPWRICM